MRTHSTWICTLAAAAPLLTGIATDAVASGAPATAGARPGRVADTRARAVQVIDCEGYFLTVDDLDRSLTFYRDVVGLSVMHAAEPARVLSAAERLTSTPGARVRSAALNLPDPGHALLLVEFTRIDRRRLKPHVVDPGAVMLDVRVTRLDTVLAAARRLGATVLARADRPVTTSSGERAIVLIDPDGFYVRISQLAPVGATPVAPAVLGARMAFTVAESGPVVRFYHDVLGLGVERGSAGPASGFDELMGASRVRPDVLRVGTGDAELLQFVAYNGVARHTYLPRPQDPGAAGASIAVADLTAALRRIRAAGAIVVSAGGQPVITAQGQRAILIRDPAGLLLELVQR